MKRIFHHPPEPKTGKRYWRSLHQFAKTPAAQVALEREFPAGAAEMKDENEAETTRRSFLKLMGASTALAGLAACRRPEIHIRPYAKAPEWVIPGKALFYATAMPRIGGCSPLVVHTYEGRPTHLQGNKLHPDSNGGLDCLAQASILNLYDPNRAQIFTRAEKKVEREDFLKFFDTKKAELAGKQGTGLAILLDEAVTPTRHRLIGELLKKYPQAKIYSHEAFGQENVKAAYAAAFGPGAVPAYRIELADRVFSLDCDFLGLDRMGNASVGQFMSRRTAEKPDDGAKMSRLYSVEGRYTITGGMADHRLRVHASQTLKVAVALAGKIAEKTGDAALKAAAAAVKLKGQYKPRRADYEDWLQCAADDLVEKKGASVVLAGSPQGSALHLLAIAINQALGAFGKIIEVKKTAPVPSGTLAELAKAAAAKQIDTLITIGENDPVWEAPSDIVAGGLTAALKNVPNFIVHSTRYRSATARAASWVVPATHYLEQWGDTRGFEGSYAIVQPMIAPLYEGTMSDIELIQALLSNAPSAASAATPAAAPAPAAAALVEDPGPAFKAVRDTFNSLVQGANDDKWNNALRDGFVAGTVYPAAAAAPNAGAINAGLSAAVDVELGDGFEVTFVPCSKIFDGRYINNGWLQEAPDPITKLTWDNAAVVSVKTAKDLNINLFNEDSADVISIEVNGVQRYFPVLVIPGHADDAISVAVGYGQKEAGRVGVGTGFDAYALRKASTPYFVTGAKVARLTESVDVKDSGIEGHAEIPAVYPLGMTTEHQTMYGRALVREGTVDDWKENADFVLEQGTDGNLHGDREEKNKENSFSFYKPVGGRDSKGLPVPHLNDEAHQWGMVIDLNKCTGCTSCLVACQSENNIPIVGKDQVIRGREMHWIRMDRYFATDLDSDAAMKGRKTPNESWDEDQMDDPEMLVQPVACQHCEAAPCETVCPVNATVHSPDGLNVMVYNRCIGTRYCSNNCPFKVRHFNFFDYNKRNPLVEKSFLGGKYNNLYFGPLGERQDTELSKLQKNPNVSVRMRGVIEKCTYCIQRIESAKIEARAQGRRNKRHATGANDESLKIEESDIAVAADAVKTACQEACPAGAIVFGNIVDPKSTVSAWRKNSRNYELLGYLSVRARTTYLARIKNPNPALIAKSTTEATKVGQGSKTRPVHADDDSGHGGH
ncbi:MAG TPA: TAT-variant-translocated molybdopterin oxidoreductase [Verrucomicrobiales bacterium]|jgi:molybdopterin-containing oxidoreductase family iron-sulfur binding subunit|nr:TAT-variant-translocated molybdopterin oxidoreductase [Verrucomicrobiales bacterium]